MAGSVQPACVVPLRWGAGTEVLHFCRESQLCAYGAGIRSELALSAGTRGGYVSPCLKHPLALNEQVWPYESRFLAHRKGNHSDICQRR